MTKPRDIRAYVTSLVLHLVVLIPLAYIHLESQSENLNAAIETVFSEDRPTEEFTRELNQDTEIADTMNVMAGAQVVSAVASGGTAPAVAEQKIENSQAFKDPEIAVNAGAISLPGLDQLGDDLGEAEVVGEVSAAVEGYGAALGRITQELLRMMREDRVLVVWLYDESESMKDDQAEIRDQFHKVYQELGLVQEKDSQVQRKGKEVLLTAIHSFGKEVRAITDKPTADIPTIRAAIDKIPNDESGKENMCMALNMVLDKYRSIAQRSKRKLAIILVSDESGDDGQLIDETISKAKRANAPIYILGREAVFGFPYARIRYKDPQYGLTHWLTINRGPETPEPEALQYDGLTHRWDAHSSGFGPYEQARLARDSGGIFFVLPSEEQNLIGAEAVKNRKFQFLDMKEYVPDLGSRRDYETERKKSKFRSAVWEVIVLLNPYRDKQLSIKIWPYSLNKAEFAKEGQVEFNKSLRAMGLLNQAFKILEKAKPLRDKEESQRWRANFDLIYAQVLAYRVRQFQFLLAMDQMGKNFPTPKNPKSNEWHLQWVKEMLPPDPEQVKITKIDLDELNRQLKMAKDQFAFVIKTHPGTPWKNRAQYELNKGFSIRFVENFRDPRYKTLTVKLPKF